MLSSKPVYRLTPELGREHFRGREVVCEGGKEAREQGK